MPQTRYGPESSERSESRIREDSGKLALPEFDSLPATAGLDNTQAFRLSIRHALSLLPALFRKGMDVRSHAEFPGRFSIR